jgi:PleD family two-component response regulator
MVPPTFDLASKPDILIVDDKPDNLRILSVVLVEKDYQVRKAISGEMALKAVEAATPDLILLDIEMPDRSGYEICKMLKAFPDTAQIPIIFMSARDGVFDKVLAFDVGGADYITKPFEAQEVFVRVRNQLMIVQQTKKLQEQNLLLQQEVELRKQVQASLEASNRQFQAAQQELNQLKKLYGF